MVKGVHLRCSLISLFSPEWPCPRSFLWGHRHTSPESTSLSIKDGGEAWLRDKMQRM